MRTKTLSFQSTQEGAEARLNRSLSGLGATDLRYGINRSSDGKDLAFIEFRYKGTPYKFEYSRATAEYFHIKVPVAKDLFVALVITIEDIVKNAQRGIYDFSRFAEGFKALSYIELPGWASAMMLTAVPRAFEEVKKKYHELGLTIFNPETNPNGFMALQKAYQQAKIHFGVVD